MDRFLSLVKNQTMSTQMFFLLIFFCVVSSGCQTTPTRISDHIADTKTFEVVSFRSEDSTLITGLLFRPEGPGPFPAIVALHGCAGLFKSDGRLNPRELDWGSRLAANGYVKLPSDFRIAIAFYPGCVRAQKNLSWRNRVPLEVLMGESDNWTLTQPCISIVERLKDKTKINITLYPDAYHDFDAPNLPLKVLHNLTYAPAPHHAATIGTNEKARDKAIERVLSLLRATL